MRVQERVRTHTRDCSWVNKRRACSCAGQRRAVAAVRPHPLSSHARAARVPRTRWVEPSPTAAPLLLAAAAAAHPRPRLGRCNGVPGCGGERATAAAPPSRCRRSHPSWPHHLALAGTWHGPAIGEASGPSQARCETAGRFDGGAVSTASTASLAGLERIGFVALEAGGVGEHQSAN